MEENKLEARAKEMLNDPKYADLFDPDKTDADTNPLYDSEDNELSEDDAAAVRYARRTNLWEKVKGGSAEETPAPVEETPAPVQAPRQTVDAGDSLEERQKNPWML